VPASESDFSIMVKTAYSSDYDEILARLSESRVNLDFTVHTDFHEHRRNAYRKGHCVLDRKDLVAA
jgi:hypothetical protein